MINDSIAFSFRKHIPEEPIYEQLPHCMGNPALIAVNSDKYFAVAKEDLPKYLCVDILYDEGGYKTSLNMTYEAEEVEITESLEEFLKKNPSHA